VAAQNAEIVRRLYEGFNRERGTRVKQSHLWTIRRGRAVRFEWFRDPDRAFDVLEAGA
jgi:hypothetical protein